jgi:hypothetical protein
MKKCLNSGLYEQGFEATKTMYLVGEGVILVGNQQDGGKKRQISTPVSAFHMSITMYKYKYDKGISA